MVDVSVYYCQVVTSQCSVDVTEKTQVSWVAQYHLALNFEKLDHAAVPRGRGYQLQTPITPCGSPRSSPFHLGVHTVVKMTLAKH